MQIVTKKFNQDTPKTVRKIEYGKDWPVVYVLENGKEMYIGETVSAMNRLKQHYEKEDRRRLTKAHIITDDEFNKSATLDIESWLIQYMVADIGTGCKTAIAGFRITVTMTAKNTRQSSSCYGKNFKKWVSPIRTYCNYGTLIYLSFRLIKLLLMSRSR